MPTTKKVVFRDSVRGRFVTERFAVRNPRETEREVVKMPVPPKRK